MIAAAAPVLGAEQTGFDGLTAAARRTLGGDGLLIVLAPDACPPTVVASRGLAPGELTAVGQALAERREGYLEREFPGVLEAPIALEDHRLGTIIALKRHRGDFDNAELIRSFACQVATALGVQRLPAALDQRLETHRALDDLVLAAHSLRELCVALRGVLGPLFSGSNIAVLVYDSSRNVLQMIPGSFGANDKVTASHQVSIFDRRSNSARVFATGQPYLSNESSEDAGIRREYVEAFSVQRLLSVPLHSIGVLHIANKPSPFTIEDADRALVLAPRIASVVELASTLFGLRRQQQLEEILARVAVAIAGGAASGEILAPALEELCATTEASVIAIVTDVSSPIVARCGPFPAHLARSVLDQAAANPGIRAYVVSPQKAGDPGWAAFYVPIMLGTQRMGTLAAARSRGEPFAEADRRALLRMANLAALAGAAQRYQQQRTELARLQERQRIADDLHDDVSQILFAAQLRLDGLLAEFELDPDLSAGIARARALLIRGDTAIRTVIHRLSSPPAADIGTRLVSVAAGVEEEFSLTVRMQISDTALARAKHLRRAASDAFVRVTREALVNAAKHAGPCRVDVSLTTVGRDRLRLLVSDDGVGATPTRSRRHGLSSVRRVVGEHGGTLRITHPSTGGTCLSATLPVATVGHPHEVGAGGRS